MGNTEVGKHHFFVIIFLCGSQFMHWDFRILHQMSVRKHRLERDDIGCVDGSIGLVFHMCDFDTTRAQRMRLAAIER